MLILSRRPGESVKIGDEVTITVLDVKGNQLRLGFSAPANVAIHREEVYRRIQAERLDKTLQSGATDRGARRTVGLAPAADDPPVAAVLKIRSA